MANPKDRAAAVARKLVRVKVRRNDWEAYLFDAEQTFETTLKDLTIALRRAGVR